MPPFPLGIMSVCGGPATGSRWQVANDSMAGPVTNHDTKAPCHHSPKGKCVYAGALPPTPGGSGMCGPPHQPVVGGRPICLPATYLLWEATNHGMMAAFQWQPVEVANLHATDPRWEVASDAV